MSEERFFIVRESDLVELRLATWNYVDMLYNGRIADDEDEDCARYEAAKMVVLLNQVTPIGTETDAKCTYQLWREDLSDIDALSALGQEIGDYE